jgi:hypothetical protein
MSDALGWVTQLAMPGLVALGAVLNRAQPCDDVASGSRALRVDRWREVCHRRAWRCLPSATG